MLLFAMISLLTGLPTFAAENIKCPRNESHPVQFTHTYPDGSRLAVCGGVRPGEQPQQGFQLFDSFTVEDLAKPATSSVIDEDEGEWVYFRGDTRRGIVRRNKVDYCEGPPRWLFEWTYKCSDHHCSLSERKCVSEGSRGHLDPKVAERVIQFLNESKTTRTVAELQKHPACNSGKLLCQAYSGDTKAFNIVVGDKWKQKCRFENGDSIEADQRKLRDLKDANCGLR